MFISTFNVLNWSLATLCLLIYIIYIDRLFITYKRRYLFFSSLLLIFLIENVQCISQYCPTSTTNLQSLVCPSFDINKVFLIFLGRVLLKSTHAPIIAHAHKRHDGAVVPGADRTHLFGTFHRNVDILKGRYCLPSPGSYIYTSNTPLWIIIVSHSSKISDDVSNVMSL